MTTKNKVSTKNLFIASLNLGIIVFTLIVLGGYFSTQLQNINIFWGFLVLSGFSILNSYFFHKEGVIDEKLRRN